MAAFTENVILRDPSTGLAVGFIAGDEAPEWAASMTTHIDGAEASVEKPKAARTRNAAN